MLCPGVLEAALGCSALGCSALGLAKLEKKPVLAVDCEVPAAGCALGLGGCSDFGVEPKKGLPELPAELAGAGVGALGCSGLGLPKVEKNPVLAVDCERGCALGCWLARGGCSDFGVLPKKGLPALLVELAGAGVGVLGCSALGCCVCGCSGLGLPKVEKNPVLAVDCERGCALGCWLARGACSDFGVEPKKGLLAELAGAGAELGCSAMGCCACVCSGLGLPKVEKNPVLRLDCDRGCALGCWLVRGGCSDFAVEPKKPALPGLPAELAGAGAELGCSALGCCACGCLALGLPTLAKNPVLMLDCDRGCALGCRLVFCCCSDFGVEPKKPGPVLAELAGAGVGALGCSALGCSTFGLLPKLEKKPVLGDDCDRGCALGCWLDREGCSDFGVLPKKGFAGARALLLEGCGAPLEGLLLLLLLAAELPAAFRGPDGSSGAPLGWSGEYCTAHADPQSLSSQQQGSKPPTRVLPEMQRQAGHTSAALLATLATCDLAADSCWPPAVPAGESGEGSLADTPGFGWPADPAPAAALDCVSRL